MAVTFQLEGQAFMALNGGPQFTFSPAISFFVNCETQAEVDELWERLSADGEKQQCAWLIDKFGRVVADRPEGFARTDAGQRPGEIAKGLQSRAANDPFDIEGLRQAYRGE
jgi:hypothetical protein